MLRRTRVGGTIDMGRASQALSRPGIDPRVWACEAVVLAKKVTTDGFFVDVSLMPDGIEETARVGTVYAGNGFGFYFPIEVDDTVLVVAPHGDPDMGLVVVSRFWCQADPSPAKAVSNPEDVVLEVKAGRTVRVRTAGAGNIVLEPAGSGQVYLGQDGASHPACRGDNLQATLNALISAYNIHTHDFPAPIGAPTTPPVIGGGASSSGSGDLSPNVKVK